MFLPLVDEIREARRLAEESADATLFLHRVEPLATSLALLDAHLTKQSDRPIPLPGDDLIDELLQRWPSLPAPEAEGDTPRERLLRRRRFLDAARSALEPLQSTSHDRNHRLKDLQSRQLELLDTPEYEAARAEIRELVEARTETTHQLEPVRVRAARLEPLRRSLSISLERLREQIQKISDTALDPKHAWRTGTLANAMVSSLRDLVDGLQLELRLPPPIDLPPTPELARPPQLLIALETLFGELVTLGQRIVTQHEDEKAHVDRLTAHLDHLTQQLLDRLG